MKNQHIYVLTGLLVVASCNTSTRQESSSSLGSEPVMFTQNQLVAERTSLATARFPSYNPNFPPPSGTPNLFELSQDYPTEYSDEEYPWKAIDFKTHPNEYMNAVLNYSLQGNVEVDFRGQDNAVRKWYHAPWLHDDGRPNGNGREFIHGLTRERGTPKFEIHDNQDVELENWAVGMYNAPGGHVLGKIWKTPSGKPNPSNANFPEGTVSFKLLFTDGTLDKVPFLENTLEWDANIYACSPRRCGVTTRENRRVRLLQIDIAVKDNRATDIGWVFGTFMYDAAATGSSVWERMVPVGLSWGDDPTVVSRLNDDGAFINSDLRQSYINEELIADQSETSSNKAYIKYHGLGGRLNGPVDNPISSCISCHGQAAINQNGFVMPMGNFRLTRESFTVAEFQKFFSNPNSGAYQREFEGQEYTTTDYSLQVSAGIRNYFQNERFKSAIAARVVNKSKSIESFSIDDLTLLKEEIEQLPEVSRGEVLE